MKVKLILLLFLVWSFLKKIVLLCSNGLWSLLTLQNEATSQSSKPIDCQWFSCGYYYFIGVHINLQLIASLRCTRLLQRIGTTLKSILTMWLLNINHKCVRDTNYARKSIIFVIHFMYFEIYKKSMTIISVLFVQQ